MRVKPAEAPDPVLQQVENLGDPTVTANDTFRPVAGYWDRITRPEQILVSAPAALRVLLDPADCGPAVLALPQDVQAEAFDCPPEFLAERVHAIRRPNADAAELARAAEILFDRGERGISMKPGANAIKADYGDFAGHADPAMLQLLERANREQIGHRKNAINVWAFGQQIIHRGRPLLFFAAVRRNISHDGRKALFCQRF